ncbi:MULTISPECIES: hypothetical protein [Leisingera]|jgi:hypothetical protein|uniref:hypothetical protein n=1 Tax=Leisingera TaxID=191028 RepID=UPI00114F1A24|nr:MULTISPECIES: hypothetical protein [Leisingera]QDI76306.1 hypothetical protein R2C4_11285 [Leisingera aquaemixtae]UWQ46941.1 hypothetical protein K3719_06170 [Leisingera aquaemixtae]
MADQSEIEAVTFGSGRVPLEYLDFFEVSNGRDAREVMLAVFRSDLGRELNSREPSSQEVSSIRATVSLMVRFAASTDAGLPDDYFVELVNGPEADYRTIPPSRRVVFGLENLNWKTGDLIRIEVSE